MMPTQIIQLELGDVPATIPVRDDVQSLFVLLCANGCPVELLCVPRPAGDVLVTQEILASRQGRVEASAGSNDATPANEDVPVSVIICTHERPDDLARCLESLSETPRGGHDIIVVDNCPVTDRTAAVAARFDVQYIVEPARGLDRARNAGARAAKNDLIAFVDDDVVVTPRWRQALAACFSDPDVGCATGLVLPLELETVAQEEFEIYSLYRRSLRRRVYSRDAVPSSAAAVVGIGANMAYRRELVLALGGFDARLDAGTRTRAGGDTDMFARVLDSGHRILYTPDAYVWHRYRRSTEEMRSSVFGYSAGTYSVLTKRLVEQGDFRSLVTAARWFLGPWINAARNRIAGGPKVRWRVVIADSAGAACGPFCFAYEAWRARRGAAAVSES